MTKAIFFDRDGTLLVEFGYVAHPTLVVPYAFTAEALRRAKDSGFLLIVVTNQSGIARGWLSEKDLDLVHKRMQSILGQAGVALDAIYYCPHHPDATVETYRKRCTCRKPGTALGEMAIRRFSIDVTRSFVIGDKATDLRFGKALGLGPCLVRTGFGTREENQMRDDGLRDVRVVESVLEAVDWAIREDGKRR